MYASDLAAIQAGQMKANEAAAALAAQQKAEEDARLAALREAAAGTARSSAQRYFQQRGLDPAQYSGDIESELQDLLSTVNTQDPNPGLYLRNLGEQTFQNLQNAQRESATRQANLAFGPDYANQRISSTLDDPILADIDAAQRGRADEYIQNLLKRHVITDTGAAGARRNLEEQGAAVRSQLGQIGSDVLSEGRGKLSDILGRARSSAGNVQLGQNYDIAPYQNELDQAYNEFTSNLGENIKSQLGGPLYDTSGLAAAAGAASGAQNTKFDPLALAGIPEEEQPIGTTPGTPRRRLVF